MQKSRKHPEKKDRILEVGSFLYELEKNKDKCLQISLIRQKQNHCKENFTPL